MPHNTKKIRNYRLAAQIQKALSSIIPSYLNFDTMVTVSYVDLSSDLMNAKIYVTILNLNSKEQDQDKIQLCNTILIKHLNSIKPKIRSQLISYIKVRSLPDIKFYLDEQLEHANHIESLIQKVRNQ